MHGQKNLLHNVYKARYFPHNHLFEAKLGNNPSYVWRGVWKALSWLKKGCL